MTKDAPQTESFDRHDLITRDGHALFASTGRAVAGQGVALIAGLATTILTIRLLDRASYGRFALFFMFLEITSHFIAWPNLGLVRFGREELADRGRLAQTFWARIALFILCAAGVAFMLRAFRKPLAGYLQLEYAINVLLFLYVVLNGFVLLARSVFQTVTRFRAYAFALAATKVGNLLLILLLFVLLRSPASPGRIIAVHIASFAAVCLLCLFLLPWKILIPLEINLHWIKRMVGYSWPLLPAGLCAFIVNWVDLTVIRHFGHDWQVGVYAAAYQPVTVLIMLHVAVLSAVAPLLVSLVLDKRREILTWYLREVLPQLAWLLGLGALALVVVAELIPWVLGPSYQPAVVPCQVLMAGVACFIFFGFQSALAKALDRTRAVFLIGLLTALLNVLFDLALVPRFGIRGAAVATAAAFILSGLFYFPVLNTAVPASAKRYLAVLGLLPCLLMGAGALYLDHWLHRVALCVALAGVAVATARSMLPFSETTRENLDALHLSPRARKIVVMAISLLTGQSF